jgi:hypothetical protein
MAPAWNAARPFGWIPVSLSARDSVARWIYLGRAQLMEPFFFQDVASLRRQGAAEIEADIAVLDETYSSECESAPAGIIFHMSRCGSTLVSNALRKAENVVTLAEAQPCQVAMALAARSSRYWARRSAQLLRGLIRSFANYREGENRRVVIKCSVQELGAIRSIRAIWPQVPCVILIRNPTEVVVSNLRRPPKWLKPWERTTWFGQAISDAKLEREADYVAWVVGEFCIKARGAIDRYCRVVDYEQLSPETIREIAKSFGLHFSPTSETSLQKTFQMHSKDKRPFVRDMEAKQRSADEGIRASVNRWATEPYLELRNRVMKKN